MPAGMRSAFFVEFPLGRTTSGSTASWLLFIRLDSGRPLKTFSRFDSALSASLSLASSPLRVLIE